MHGCENMPDEIPVADAVEQDQETAPEPTPPREDNPPMEANTADWQEQLQEVVDDDREEYRD
jgi:hypothetical protein